jgi:hypothetical protein
MASWIKADGTEVAVGPKNGRTFTLDELHGFVRGDDPDDEGFIEIVRPHLRGWETLYMVVNENGKRYGLPVNWNATAIYAHPGIPRNLPPNVLILGDPADFEHVVGNVLLCFESEID